MMVKRLFLWGMALLLLVAPLAGTSPGTVVLAEEAAPSTESGAQSGTDPSSDDLPNYYEYLRAHNDAGRPAVVIEAQPPAAPSTGVDIGASVEGKQNVVVLQGDKAPAVWTLQAETAGLYALRIEYLLRMDNSVNARLDVKINGEYPHKSAQMIPLPRRFETTKGIEQDSQGNDRRPEMGEIRSWESWLLDDPETESAGYLLFYLKAGSNTVELIPYTGGVAVGRVEALQPVEAKPYTAYLKEKASETDRTPSGYYKEIEAENCGQTSDSVLVPTYDRSSAATQPNDPAKLRLNTIGQSSWNMAGQWIEWEIEAPEDGFYEIGMRVRQNELRGFFSTRRVSIDGEVLYKELENVQFSYALDWYVTTLGGDEPYRFYLTKGKHTLRMEATQGTVAQSVAELQDLTLEMNTLYRNVIMITGVTVDTYRDYMLEQQIPDLLDRLKDIRARLEEQMHLLASLGVKGGSDAVVIDKLIYQIDSFLKNPRTMPARMDDFLSNVSSMSSWALSMVNQPLEIDYLYLKAPGVADPKAGAGFFQQFLFRLQALGSSFVEDYSNIAGAGNGETAVKESIRLWVATGRDQGQVIKDLTENYFTQETGIDVKLSLMQSGLNEAIAAGRGPDMALLNAELAPSVINFASRDALADIRQYEDFSKVASRFNPNTLIPYQYKGGVYALPIEQTVLMMYYRTDIFKELGLQAPATWDDFQHVLTVLQKNHLTAGLFAGNSVGGDTSIFELLMYQAGGSLFNEDLTATTLDSDIAYQTFKQWTDYYVEYGLMPEFDFYNRFRSGEMPIGIQAQNMYVTLRMAAPELDGLWEMVPVPQTVKEDGSVSQVSFGALTPFIVLDTPRKEACFRYLDWYTSADTQVAYGQEVENVLGMGARYYSANLEAVSRLNWTTTESQLLLSQMKQSVFTPNIPASYYVSRNIVNAFRKVIISGYYPRESLLSYNKIINSEITRKNAELARRDAMKKGEGRS